MERYVVRSKSMFDGRGKTCIDMPIIQFPIQDQKMRIVINDRSNGICFRPRCLLVEFLSNPIELIFVTSLHFIDIIFEICMVKMRQISSHSIRNLYFLPINIVYEVQYHWSMVLLLLV